MRARRVPLLAVLLTLAAAQVSGCAWLRPSGAASSPEAERERAAAAARAAAIPENEFLVRPMDGGAIRILYTAPDEPWIPDVEEALRIAQDFSAKWGKVRRSIRVIVYPNHPAFEHAIGRPGYSWLRGWSTYATFHIHTPRAWVKKKKKPGGALDVEWMRETTRPALNELIVHEYTHIVMYHNTGPAKGWAKRDLPLWFREGMASVTACQGYRRMQLHRVAGHYLTGTDPLEDSQALYRTQPKAVYGSGHRAFDFLTARYGDGAVRGIMEAIAGGADFATAFASRVGIPYAEFRAEFGRFVMWDDHSKVRDRRRLLGAGCDKPVDRPDPLLDVLAIGGRWEAGSGPSPLPSRPVL